MSYSWETWDAWQPFDEPTSENPSAASSAVGDSSAAAAATGPASMAASSGDSTGGVAASSGDAEPSFSVPDQLAG